MLKTLIKQVKDFIKEHKKPLIVILGPTASGKTGLSLELAKAVNAEIISADSRQIYKDMEIGTEVILPEQQQGVPHHMLNFLDPNEYYTLSDYKKGATKIIKDIYKRSKIPMLVGGTGLYISAIVENYDIPKVAPNLALRKKLEQEYKKHGAEYLHAKLAGVDPESAAEIHPNNIRYVIRALEINQATNRRFFKSSCLPKKSPYDVLFFGLKWPREALYERINLRVDKQIERGLIKEVKKLMNKIKNDDAPAFSSLGCKEIAEHLKGNITLEQATELVKKNTRNYAKRQLTWFRRYKNIYWLDGAKLEKELCHK